MPRCAPLAASSRAARALLAGAALLAAWSAAAQTSRPFPANALRGTLVITQPPDATLNGEAARLSPGSRIRGADNLIKLSGQLAGQSLLVHYTREPSGLLHDVWILTADEAAKRPWPTTAEEAQRLRFDPASQTWTR